MHEQVKEILGVGNKRNTKEARIQMREQMVHRSYPKEPEQAKTVTEEEHEHYLSFNCYANLNTRGTDIQHKHVETSNQQE